MAPILPPDLPAGPTVQVKIIDTGATIKKVPASYFLEPPVEGFDYFPNLPAWSFLIENDASGQRALFDLSIPTDWREMSPSVSGRLKSNEWVIDVPNNVRAILENHGKSSRVDSIIWSHCHFDHIGNADVFPSSTELVVGPGVKDAFMPGYPTRGDSPLRESDFEGRSVREINFNGTKSRKIGKFNAFDFFGDGSFYLLDTPGHDVGHMAGLARTSTNPDTYIFMGGDICHHGAELRPSEYLPIPAHITSHPWDQNAKALCPGSTLEHLQNERNRATEEPFFDPARGLSVQETTRTIRDSQPFDANENVLFLFAHDNTAWGVVDLFPKSANDWKNKGWKERMQWAFLKDLRGYLESRT